MRGEVGVKWLSHILRGIAYSWFTGRQSIAPQQQGLKAAIVIMCLSSSTCLVAVMFHLTETKNNLNIFAN